jgi:hypothetical protein
VNDFNPGIGASGLFWTTAVADDSVDVHPGAGTAQFALSDYPTRDFHTIGNAVTGGPSDPAVVSFDMVWSGNGTSVVQTDGSTFSFDSVLSSVTVEWSAQKVGWRFQSDPASTSESVFAAVGHEKNGVFFH